MYYSLKVMIMHSNIVESIFLEALIRLLGMRFECMYTAHPMNC